MPMPALDPVRYVPVMPVDPSHKVPMAVPGRFFSQDPASPDLADTFDPYVAQLLAGGSLRRACDVETANAKIAAEKAAADAKTAADKVAVPSAPTADAGTPPVAEPTPSAEPAPLPSDPARPAA